MATMLTHASLAPQAEEIIPGCGTLNCVTHRGVSPADYAADQRARRWRLTVAGVLGTVIEDRAARVRVARAGVLKQLAETGYA